MFFVYIPNFTTHDIVDMVAKQLDAMQEDGFPTTSENLDTIMTVDLITLPQQYNHIDDEPVQKDTDMLS